MTWRHVTRRDLRSVYRSRTGSAVAALLGLSTAVLTGLFALADNFLVLAAVVALLVVCAILALVFLGTPRTVGLLVLASVAAAIGVVLTLSPTRAGDGPAPESGIFLVTTALSFVLPLVGLLGSYGAIVRERETGSVRFLLGLPNSRTDAFLGKYVSRSATILVPLGGGLLLAWGVMAITFAGGSAAAMLVVMIISAPYALLFVGIGLAASAYAETSNRAVALVVAVFVTFRPGWFAAEVLMRESVGNPSPLPAWYFWFDRLNPINAYLALAEWATPMANHPLVQQPIDSAATVATSAGFAGVVLVGWTVLGPAVGLWYFRRRDLL